MLTDVITRQPLKCMRLRLCLLYMCHRYYTVIVTGREMGQRKGDESSAANIKAFCDQISNSDQLTFKLLDCKAETM